MEEKIKKYDFEKVQTAVRMLIEGIGDNPDRSGVKETPLRVAKMYQDILNGYDEQADLNQLAKVFVEPIGSEGMVVVKDVPFYSFCEHHMVPFVGTLAIAYIPDGIHVLGLSKLVRIARIYAKKLQVQERLTEEIANAIDSVIDNRGVAVRVEAEHMCMSIRGVRAPGSKTVTTKLTGMFKDNAETRNEFLDALNRS